MAGHEAAVQRLPSLQYGLLHGSHIRDHRIGRQCSQQGFRWIEEAIQRQGQHDQATALQDAGIGVDGLG